VNLNAYYEKMKVFFDLGCMSTCCRWPPKQNCNSIIGAL